MTVRLYASPTHKAVVFSYSTDRVEGDTIEIHATNASGDVGTREAFNTGVFTLFFPYNWTGLEHITVSGSDGGEHSGDVEIP